jgi:UDP-N-acetylmuramoyl-tripeptide--D-alanyl-D-alanine ligase
MATPLPENVAPFTLDEILAATSGELLQDGPARFSGVATDTRAALAGKVFVALRGERFDAHDFLPGAAAAGAGCLVVERETEFRAEGVAIVRVASTLEALGALARAHRRRWGGQVIAVAGSAGKTTTRGAVSALCEALRPGRVHSTSGNLNNRIGLPLTLLAAAAEHELCVLEVGTNRTGEVAALGGICEPDVAVLTLIDLEHSEGLGDLDAIEVEEGSLLAALRPRGVAVGNGDDPRVRRQVEQWAQSVEAQFPETQGACTFYGTGTDAHYRIVERSTLGDRSARLTVLRSRASGGAATAPTDSDRVVFDCPLLGEPGALAATAALAVAELVEGRALEGALLSRAFEHAGEAGRLTRVVLGDGCLVLDDTYNANPASVRKSIATAAELASLRGGRLWLVLGEMRELGACTEEEHRSMGRFAAQSPAAGLVVIGSLAEPAVAAASDGGLGTIFCADAPAAVQPLLERLGPADVVLVKASRGVRAERVVEGLLRARGTRQ